MSLYVCIFNAKFEVCVFRFLEKYWEACSRVPFQGIFMFKCMCVSVCLFTDVEEYDTCAFSERIRISMFVWSYFLQGTKEYVHKCMLKIYIHRHGYSWLCVCVSVCASVTMLVIWHMNKYSATHECIMSHMIESHVTHMHELCHTYEWVISHIWMSHVTLVIQSFHSYEWVMSHLCMSYVTRTRARASLRARERNMSHMWIHMNDASYEWIM